MATVTSQEPRASQIRHRRETLRLVVLPMLLVVLFIIACLAAALLWLLPTRDQVSILADVMFTILMLCPAVLCVVSLAIGLIIGVFAMNRAHTQAAQPLRRVEDLSLQLAERTESTTDAINRRTIGASARLGFLYRWMAVLESDKGDESND